MCQLTIIVSLKRHFAIQYLATIVIRAFKAIGAAALMERAEPLRDTLRSQSIWILFAFLKARLRQAISFVCNASPKRIFNEFSS